MTDTDTRSITVHGIHLRDASDTGDGTLLEGIAVPFGERYDLWDGYGEVFDPDCDFGDTRRVKLSRDHGRLIGAVTRTESLPDGLHITARISDTADGRDAVQLIRDGVLDSFSVGFRALTTTREDTDGATILHRRKVDLLEVAVTGMPAYKGAAITGQRHTDHTITTKEPTMSDDIIARIDQLETDTRSAISALQSRPATPAPIGAQYRSMGDYLAHLAAGDDDAQRFQTETRDLITSTEAHNQSAWVADQIRLVQSRRSVANLFQHAALPETGMSVEYLTLGADTMTVADQGTEGTPLKFGKVSLGSQTAAVHTYGGYTTVSRQVIERSTTPTLDTALRALTIAYSTAIETAARAYLKTAITGATANGVETPAAPSAMTADQWIASIIDAAEAIDNRGAQMGTLVVGKDVYKALAKLTRSGNALMDLSGHGSDTIGTLDLSDVSASLFRVPVVMLPDAAADTAAFLDPAALTLWEAGGPFQLTEQTAKTLTSDYSVYGYAAMGTTFAGGITPLAPKA